MFRTIILALIWYLVSFQAHYVSFYFIFLSAISFFWFIAWPTTLCMILQKQGWWESLDGENVFVMHLHKNNNLADKKFSGYNILPSKILQA